MMIPMMTTAPRMTTTPRMTAMTEAASADGDRLSPGSPGGGPSGDAPPGRTSHLAAARRALAGIRVRVVVGYVVLLAGALLASVLVVRQVLLARVDSEIEQALAQEVEELRRLVGGVNPATGEPFGSDTAAIFDTFLARNVPSDGEAFFTLVGGRAHASSLAPPADLLREPALVAEWAGLTSPQRSDIDTSAGDARVLAVPMLASDGPPMGSFVVAFFPDGRQEEVGRAVTTVAVVGLVVLALSSIVAYSLAGRVLRPVRLMSTTARRITGSDLTSRFEVEGDDEVAELGRTFNAMLDRLESGFAAQRAFLDDVAHELRTPITIVRGHLELLGDDPRERAEAVALCTDELDRMGRYVNDLLLVAKAQQPDFLDPRPVDVGELAEGLLSRATTLGTRAWRLDCAIRPGRMWVLADPDRLTQAVVNLAANAVQHTAEHDPIVLGVALRGGELHLWVSDRGPGIEPSVRERLFSRFSRGAGSRARRPEGSGLGLAIVNAVAAAHGGRVEVASEPGHGSTFTLVVPVHDAAGGDA
jgi:signal transduction histidine kinase